jgi:hypothetical protein
MFANVLPHIWHFLLASMAGDHPSRIELDILVSGAIIRQVRVES